MLFWNKNVFNVLLSKVIFSGLFVLMCFCWEQSEVTDTQTEMDHDKTDIWWTGMTHNSSGCIGEKQDLGI